jgi:hypothetical protein
VQVYNSLTYILQSCNEPGLQAGVVLTGVTKIKIDLNKADSKIYSVTIEGRFTVVNEDSILVESFDLSN